MTTNIERATEVIKEAFDTAMSSGTRSTWAYQIAQTLADAGLLRPGLPKPNSTLDDYPEWLLETEFKNLSISALEDDGLRVTLDLLDDDMETVLHPAQYSVADAKSIAYALLAAANHAEQEQDNV